LSEVATVGGVVLLTVLLLGLSQTQPQRTLAKAVRHDSEVLITLFNDIRAGVLMGQYPFRLEEFRQLATQVRQSGEAMIEDRRNLERRTQTDALTGLGARTAFDGRLEQLHQQAHTGFTSALLLADIDNLEEINIQIGPEAGDILLKQFARQLRAALRQSDFVARFDGGRFGVLFPMTDLEKIEPVVHRLRQRLSEEFDPGSGLPRAYSWSAGLTLIANRDAQPQAALARAEHALQTAHRDGGNRTITQMPPA
jgi:diguanylate cyclase (GGDEF)-like protein